MSTTHADLDSAVSAAKDRLDKHAYEIVQRHFHESTGCPFWLEKKATFNFDPLTEVKCYDDLKKFPLFEDHWLRGGPVERWKMNDMQDHPTYVFETGGTTGVPKSRVVVNDFRDDYEIFSNTLPDQYFPRGGNWLMLGPSGPRRLRLAVEHLAQFRGGISFCIDLDPRWVVKLIKKGWMDHLKEYKKHCIDQAITILTANHNIKCMFATPKLIESLCEGLDERGMTLADTGITGIFSGGTEFTPQLNANNTLFGGALLKWIDEEAGIYAMTKLDTKRVVTKYISEIDFVSSAKQGDVIEIGLDFDKLGTTSITFSCQVRNVFTKKVILSIEKIVFVKIDENEKAVPHGKIIATLGTTSSSVV